MDATCAIQDNIHLLRLALELPQPTNVGWGSSKLNEVVKQLSDIKPRSKVNMNIR